MARPDGVSEREGIDQILLALEYRTKKEEKEIFDELLPRYGAPRDLPRDTLGETLSASPGFEAFFLDVLSIVKPFANMVVEIYSYLSESEATVTRRASRFLVSFEQARTRLEFDLANFPTQLLRTLLQGSVTEHIVQLRFPGIGQTPAPISWDGSDTEVAWRAIDPMWDADFYDNGFHRALSYAQMILARSSPDAIATIEELIEPIINRLSAVCQYVINLSPQPFELSELARNSWMTGEPRSLDVTLHEAQSFRVDDRSATAILLSQVEERPSRVVHRGGDKRVETVLDRLVWTISGLLISISWWRNRLAMRSDQQDWFVERTGKTPEAISTVEYIDMLKPLAEEYVSRLDLVVPIVASAERPAVLEALVKFLALPFWKHRWYIYELWTLVALLRVAERSWPVELLNLVEQSDGVMEWQLPGGTAKKPVAMIRGTANELACWSQRKTYHPGTGEGLEPDLRIAFATPEFHDVAIIENKDRLSAKGGDLREILARYVGGTCAQSIWIINYETFPASAETLSTEWPGRSVHLVSRFRPGLLDQEFEPELQSVLVEALGASALLEVDAVELADGDIAGAASMTPIEASLEWMGPPQDLDLHAWVIDSTGESHVYYAARGELDTPPYASLSTDIREGKGRESLEIRGSAVASVVLAVHRFSEDGALSNAQATVAVRFGDGPSVRLHPPSGASPWWHVMAIDVAGSSVQVLNHLADHVPQGE